MSIFEPAAAPWPGRALAVFRIVAGYLFLLAGTMKLFNLPPMPDGAPPVALMSQMGIGAVLELVGGALIIVGLLTRPTAFILCGEMAVAYFQFHAPQGLLLVPNSNGGVPAVMLCFFFFYLMFAGAGSWSVDEILARRQVARRAAPAARAFG